MLKRLVIVVLSTILVGGAIHASPFPLPGSGLSPSIGDPVSNLGTLINAYTQGSGYGSGASISASQTSGQANCTQTGLVNMMHVIGTSASTGYICLPPAKSGRLVMYFNATSQTIDLYGQNGTSDTINTTAGSTAYTGLTTHKSTICFSPADGQWACGSIS